MERFRLKFLASVLLFVLGHAAAAASSVSVSDLKTEYLVNPLGIDRLAPRFEWKVVGEARGLVQTTYQINVGRSAADGSVWRSTTMPSNATVQIAYGGPALSSATVYRWSVTVTTRDLDKVTSTIVSPTALFSMGILTNDEWGSSGQFIGPTAFPSQSTCPWFRKTFTLPATAAAAASQDALLHLASVGYHELSINGKLVDSIGVLLPSISFLPKRVLYRTYNVSSFLNTGVGEKNVIAVWAAAGWGTYADLIRGGPAVHAPLILVKLSFGNSAFSVESDATWVAKASNLVSNGGGPGGGDAVDDRNALPGWNTVSLNDSTWTKVTTFAISSFAKLQISSDAIEPTRRHSSVPAATVTAIDFPQENVLLPQSEWWGPSSTRAQPAAVTATTNAQPFCGHSSLDPISPKKLEYEDLKLTCPGDGDTIKSIEFAVWGVPTGGKSCSSWVTGDPCGDAGTKATMSWVIKNCVNVQTCRLSPIHALGDPCRGKVKTLAVTATCNLGSGVATAVPTHGPGPAPPAKGAFLITMNELYTGWFEVKHMVGSPGSTVNFQISTTAGKVEEFGMTDSYTFGPSGSGSFRMRFAYHEIQYITVTGLKTAPKPEDVIGYRLTSLGKRSGDFTSSNDLISLMYSTTVNNYRGLTTGGMTVDCPHRERRGYGGDGHTSYQFALANYPVGAFFHKWQRDFADVQGEDTKWDTPAGAGFVPNTAPTVSGGGGPAWSGFTVTNPWQTYNTFGDVTILEDMYPTMVKLLAFYENKTLAADGLLHPWGPSQWDFLGDWITPHGSEGNVTSPENLLFNNCYLHYITTLLAKISAILGDAAASTKYDADAVHLAAAVNKAFGNASTGVYVDTLQTHAVMPLMSPGLVPKAVASKTWDNLANQILNVNSGHLDTGLTGTYVLVKVLMEAGRNDLIFAFANKTDFPSYGYFLELGYTTWPEQWDVSSGNSLMHGCYNAIGLWFIEGVAGIRVHASEYPPLTIRAGVDAGDITWAKGHRVALHGRASSSWKLLPKDSSSSFTHNLTIPAGGVAKVMVPCMEPNCVAEVTEGGQPVAGGGPGVVGVSVLGVETVNTISYAVLNVVAGSYSFQSGWSRV